MGRNKGVAPGQSRDRKSKVPHFHRIVRANEAVGRLDVTVQHAASVGGFKAGDDIKDCINRFGYWQRAVFLEFVLKSAGSGDFHRNRREALDFLTAKNIETVWVVNTRGQAPFAKKPLPHVRRIELLAQHFQGNATSGIKLLSFINRTHPAAPEQSKQPVAAKFTWKF